MELYNVFPFAPKTKFLLTHGCTPVHVLKTGQMHRYTPRSSSTAANRHEEHTTHVHIIVTSKS